MTSKTNRTFGLWPSPITPASLSKDLGLSEPAWDGETLLWREARSDRSAIVALPPDGQAARDLNSSFSARGGVGYGGGAYTVGHGRVYFVEAKTGRIYCQPLAGGAPAQALTPGFGACGAPVLSPDGRWLLFVRSYEDNDSLEIVATHGRAWPQKLISGDDFYMQPAWHPEGQMIAWVAWNHPNMPWDGTHLRLGRLVLAPNRMPALDHVQTLAGDAETAIFQPEFSPDGRHLAYVTDASGWWQIVLHDLQSGETRQLTDTPAEHGLPGWVQGMRTYGFTPDGRRLVFLRNQESVVTLWQIELETGREQRLALEPEYTHLDQIAVGKHGVALVASGSRTPSRLIVRSLPVTEDLPDEPQPLTRIVRRAGSEELAPAYYSQPEAVRWLAADGSPVYGLFYPPHHPQFESAGLPPLIVMVHGGPTGQSFFAFAPEVQYFTSRGWAVLEVNFRGSTGYGREYRNRLRGAWGVCDVEDAVGGAQYVADAGRVDPGRLVILGGSSGGYTVLKALEDYPGFFKAGVCRYGITNQFLMALETHKFELHYNDRLIGPLPEAAALYRERSPIFFAERIRDPLALFQGEDDPVVPRAQLDELVAVLRRRGVPHVYHVYPGEGHGFRQPETIAHYYRAVEQFLMQYVIFAA